MIAKSEIMCAVDAKTGGGIRNLFKSLNQCSLPVAR